jgi:hypothetical protein
MNNFKKTEKEFKRAYNSAIELINKGEDPKELRRQARTDIERDGFYKGWTKACEENL